MSRECDNAGAIWIKNGCAAELGIKLVFAKCFSAIFDLWKSRRVHVIEPKAEPGFKGAIRRQLPHIVFEPTDGFRRGQNILQERHRERVIVIIAKIKRGAKAKRVARNVAFDGRDMIALWKMTEQIEQDSCV